LTEKVKQVWDNPNVWKTMNILLMLVVAMFAQAGYISHDSEQRILDTIDDHIVEVVEDKILQQTVNSTFYRLGDIQADIAVQYIGTKYYCINATTKTIMFSAVDRDKTTAWAIGNATSDMVVFLLKVPYLSASMSIGAGVTVVENSTSFWDNTESEKSVWNIGSGGGGSGNNVSLPYTFAVVYDNSLYTSYYMNGSIFIQNADSFPVLNATWNAATMGVDGKPEYHQSKRIYPQAAIALGPANYTIGDNYLRIANHVDYVGAGPSSTIITSTHTTQVIAMMWSNYTFDWSIRNMAIHGKDGVTDYPLNIDCNDVPNAYPHPEAVYNTWHSLENVHVFGRQTYSIRVITDGSGGFTLSYWDDVRATGTIYMNRVFDSMFQHVNCYGLIMDSFSMNHLDNWYIGGANDPNVRLYGDSANNPNFGNIFTNFRSDNPSGVAMSVEGYSSYNVWDASEFTNRDADSGTAKYAVTFSDTAHHNLITSSYFGGTYNNGTKAYKKFLGAVSFEATTHDNRVIGNQYDFADFVNRDLFSGDTVNNNMVDIWLFTNPLNLYNATYMGDVIEGVAGEPLTFGEICYLHTDGEYYKSDANSTASMYAVVMAVDTISGDTNGTFLTLGYAKDVRWTWTVGSANPLYTSWIAGDMSQILPDQTGDQVQIVGYPIASDTVRFEPDSTVVEIA